MKPFMLSLSAVLLLLTACSDDKELGNQSPQTQANAIGFQVIKKNVLVRTPADLASTGHYNFGVFAFKSTDDTHDIMANYLVGYFGTGTDDGKGYSSDGQTTLETSRWAYEKLGNADYTYSGSEGYYTSSQTEYMSNIDHQYLRYWDKSSEYTCFYAYAPYINGASTVSYTNSSQTLAFPAGTIVDGYDDRSKYEYMYASIKVDKANYGNEVQLNFNRLTAKVNIKFYEEIAGYGVKMLDLKKGDYEGVYATPANRSGDSEPYTYNYGTLYQSAGVSIDFSQSTVAPAWSDLQNYVKDSGDKHFLKFNTPEGNTSDGNKIGTDIATASSSSTTYYAIPKDNGGLTFHVSYQLISSTGETINVYNATVYVSEEYCKWKANYAYTYIFKITKNSTGSTDSATTIDPTDPTPSSEGALYPIVFKDCVVEEWLAATDHEENIN